MGGEQIKDVRKKGKSRFKGGGGEGEYLRPRLEKMGGSQSEYSILRRGGRALITAGEETPNEHPIRTVIVTPGEKERSLSWQKDLLLKSPDEQRQVCQAGK